MQTRGKFWDSIGCSCTCKYALFIKKSVHIKIRFRGVLLGKRSDRWYNCQMPCGRNPGSARGGRTHQQHCEIAH